MHKLTELLHKDSGDPSAFESSYNAYGQVAVNFYVQRVEGYSFVPNVTYPAVICTGSLLSPVQCQRHCITPRVSEKIPTMKSLSVVNSLRLQERILITDRG